MPAHQLKYKRYAKMALPEAEGALMAELRVPIAPSGLIIFMHGGNRAHYSPSNLRLADEFNQAGFATFLADLLTAQEAITDELSLERQFDIELLGQRAGVIVEWVQNDGATVDWPVGIFATSTGAAAALIAAAEYPDTVLAVVSSAGRPDLALSVLRAVNAPTLMIVGEKDDIVLSRNREALREMVGPKKLEIVRGAGHLFDEGPALDCVGDLSVGWFQDNIVSAERRAVG
jgi:pimeloyl-ACP methyl ester carboxylesterase